MSVVASAYFRVFEPLLAFNAESRQKTTEALRAARIRMLPEWYLTLSYLAAASAGAVVMIASGVLLWGAEALPSAARGVLAIGFGFATFLVVRLGFLAYPRVVASGRGRSIDAEFPSVVTLCYALARGGVDAVSIFRVVAEERETYGEASVEFAFVVREIERVGKDMNSALLSVAATTPSVTLKGFLEGLVTILNSGADPRDYFKRQAELQLANGETAMQREIETAGMLGESYVSGLLVLPLLLIVVLTVLSTLSPGGSQFIPLIVFVLIPGGTAAFLVLLDMMLPADTLTIPKARPEPLSDFGIGSTPTELLVLPPPRAPTVEDVADDLRAEARQEADVAKPLHRRLYLEWVRRRVGAAWRNFVNRALVRPAEALQVSGLLAVGVLVAGTSTFWFLGWRGKDLTVGLTGVSLATLLVATIPVGIFHEIRVHRARRVEVALPEVLSKLAGFNEKGVSLLRSFQIMGRAVDGELGREFRALDRDVRWTANLRAAITRMRQRVSTRRMTKLAILFERGISATGNLKDVLEIAASEARVSEGQRSRKRAAMMTYVVVVYLVFAVFLYVIYIVTDLFYGADSAFATGNSAAVTADAAQILFFQAVLIQGLSCGMIAGKLGEGHVLSGIKHSAVMGLVAWATFHFGILA